MSAINPSISHARLARWASCCVVAGPAANWSTGGQTADSGGAAGRGDDARLSNHVHFGRAGREFARSASCSSLYSTGTHTGGLKLVAATGRASFSRYFLRIDRAARPGRLIKFRAPARSSRSEFAKFRYPLFSLLHSVPACTASALLHMIYVFNLTSIV